MLRRVVGHSGRLVVRVDQDRWIVRELSVLGDGVRGRSKIQSIFKRLVAGQ